MGGIKRGISGEIVSALMAMLLMTGCSGTSKEIKRGESELPLSNMLTSGGRTEGSLWRADLSRNFYFQDTNASHVGDIVTVRVVENAKGSKDAKTKSGRSSTLSASTTAFLGIPTATTGKFQAGADFSNSFDGSGSTSRSGTLTADVTAVVTAVLPNGNMVIEGRREVSINSEKEFISLRGVIRPEDIGPGNTILSTFIADAKIEYTGHGVLNDKQRPGWLIRILDWIWPF